MMSDAEQSSYVPTGHLYVFFREMQIKATMRWSEWPLLESLHVTNVGEGTEKREPSYTVDGNINWYSHYRKQYGGSSEN